MSSEVNAIRSLIVRLVAVLGAVLFLGGVVVAIVGRSAETEFTLFGQEFTSTSVGVALAFIGAVVVALTFRRVLKSLDRSEARPLPQMAEAPGSPIQMAEAPPPPQTLRDGKTPTADQKSAFLQVWNELVALERAGCDLWNELTDFTLSQFADRWKVAMESIRSNALFFSDDDYQSLLQTMHAANLYLGGKKRLADIRNGKLFGVYKLAGKGETNRFVDERIKEMIRQNRRWLSRYRNLLQDIRSRFHRAVVT
ncbi:MAG TPA: hypothetical protein VMY42_27665 [Thermoguttaceae bacterium]|nr:hypothetical protein [Thermoguttaceae bacterium]